MRKIIGTCGKTKRHIVYWFEGDGISVPTINIAIITDTRNKEEAVEICRRNLVNFVEA